ncbi:MAG TPA: UDP-glucose 4-epimerase GalE [Saprospiraceae bacterium]|nr:UDP-glucose 4-epimerase GalE [Saprospiraceae bacterium]HMQ81638.1 UDP-glucose 4-epimerase GalE [Saprospiraceae bacterium]
MGQKILITGGCGYIGSHTIVDLIEKGFEVVSVDDWSNSDAASLLGIAAITGREVTNYAVNLCDKAKTRSIFEAHPDIVGIIHFAAHKFVGESVEKPLKYFSNNLYSLLNLLELMEEFAVRHLIFSSSCSVYGNARELPVTEETPLQDAESPYARTKQMGEYILKDYARANPGQNSVILRYFNPAGAHPSALLGESPINPASNLVPVITETAIGKRGSMTVFGNDYPTRDGSCIRDYIHVMDLADAHTKALEYLLAEKNSSNCEVFNLGIGEGVSVLEAINAFIEVSNVPLNYELGARRPGDVVAIYSNFDKAAQHLGWQPQYGIRDIMETAWRWEQRRSG